MEKKVPKKRPTRRFDRLSGAGKRVMVAKDVIRSLQLKKLIATMGTYGSYNNNYPYTKQGEPAKNFTKLKTVMAKDTEELGDVLKRQLRRCEACAVGSLFVSTVLRADKLGVEKAYGCSYSGSTQRIGNSPNVDTLKAYLLGFFTQGQLNLIEIAFEGWDIEEDEPGPAKAFGEKYKTPHSRMIAIMRNIVKNKGEFRP